MLPHLSTRPPRKPWLWWLRRDLSERLILRGLPDEGDLVMETDVCVAVDDAERAGWTLPVDSP
jgi:hypothetical protein